VTRAPEAYTRNCLPKGNRKMACGTRMVEILRVQELSQSEARHGRPGRTTNQNDLVLQVGPGVASAIHRFSERR
jgi:hypothetical protein